MKKWQKLKAFNIVSNVVWVDGGWELVCTRAAVVRGAWCVVRVAAGASVPVVVDLQLGAISFRASSVATSRDVPLHSSWLICSESAEREGERYIYVYVYVRRERKRNA